MRWRRSTSAFLRRAIAAAWLDGAEVRLLDIGASGGISPFWDQFRPYLRALGIDPLKAEVARLNAAESDPAIRYVEGWVGNGTAPPVSGWARMMHARTSAWRAEQAARANYARDVFNSGAALAYSARRLTVDELVRDGAIADPDVIKIDVDFYEGFVLEGAARTIADGRVLLVECECGFHELADPPPDLPGWRGFADVDLMMRQSGYRLLDLEVFRYTRDALPGRFSFEAPASTDTGQAQWCDAIWFVDPSIDEAALRRLAPEPGKLTKLILLLEAYGYPDVAAAVLGRLASAGVVPPAVDPCAALDWLVPENPFGASTHAAYLAAFDAAPRRFQPSGWAEAEAADKAARMRPVAGAVEAGWFPAYAEAEVRTEARGTRIRASPLAWSYAAALALSPAALVSTEFVVEIEVEVHRGTVYATLASPDLTTIGEQHRLEAGARGGCLLRLEGSRADGRTHVLLRNGERSEPAEVLVTAVRCLQ